MSVRVDDIVAWATGGEEYYIFAGCVQSVSDKNMHFNRHRLCECFIVHIQYCKHGCPWALMEKIKILKHERLRDLNIKDGVQGKVRGIIDVSVPLLNPDL